MGYTHYFDTNEKITKEKWDNFTSAVKKLVDGCTLIQKEYNDSKKPVVNSKEVRFNGIGEDGHETFYITRISKIPDWQSDRGGKVFNFCKTARKPYDRYVVATLLLAHLYLADEIEIGSDGDVKDWQAGVRLVNDILGHHIGGEISLTKNPEVEYPDSIKTALFEVKEIA
jgi:hypothetical protein